MSLSDLGQAGDFTDALTKEVTPEMLNAGVEALCEFEPDSGWSGAEIVRAVYLAMTGKLPASDVLEYTVCSPLKRVDFLG